MGWGNDRIVDRRVQVSGAVCPLAAAAPGTCETNLCLARVCAGCVCGLRELCVTFPYVALYCVPVLCPLDPRRRAGGGPISISAFALNNDKVRTPPQTLPTPYKHHDTPNSTETSLSTKATKSTAR